jgi:GDPmannose 4,6-dehydratase
VGLDYRKFVIVDPKFYRPAEVYDLIADASKARGRLGWRPQYRFEDLVREMVENDLDALKRGIR